MEPWIRGAFALDPRLAASVVTLGAFDGVHRGHQALIAKTVEAARRLGLPSIAYTFDPHPALVLAPAVAPRAICSLEERVRLLRHHGIDRVIVEPFDAAFAQIAADDWVRRFLVGQLAPRHVVVGFNFSYGRGRGGDPAHLAAAGRAFDFSVDVVDAVVVGGIVASSTRVREFLLEGNLAGVELLLGRRHAVTGVVVEGDRRGRTIGFPTANVDPDHDLLPAHGVYASRVTLAGGERKDGVTNIGRRPTFGGRKVTVETFIFDHSAEIYGQPIRIELIARLREERRFDGIAELKAQLERDVAEARRALGAAS